MLGESIFIIVFTYFYTAVTFNPVDQAENLRKYGGFIPGVRPGRPTAEFLDRILARLTFPGALFLAAIAALPTILISQTNANFFFGGTSILIVIGVALDTMKQLEAQLMMRNYEGFLERSSPGGLAARARDLTDPTRGRMRLLALTERAGELAPRLDVELAVRVAQVVLDRLGRDEQRLGDLAVALTRGGELGDPALARGQRRRPAEQRLAARARAGRGELDPGALVTARPPRRGAPCPPPAAAGPRASVRRFSRRSAAPEVDQRADRLEARRRVERRAAPRRGGLRMPSASLLGTGRGSRRARIRRCRTSVRSARASASPASSSARSRSPSISAACAAVPRHGQ